MLLADQGPVCDGSRSQRCRPLTPSPDRGLRGEPSPSANGSHRPLSGSRMGRADAARGDSRGTRSSAAERQDSLRRLLELCRLAGDEGARDREANRLTRVRQPAGVFVAAGEICGVRDRSFGDRSGSRACSSGARSPAGFCPASTGVDSPRRRGPVAQASGPSRRSTTRASSTTRSRRCSRSPIIAACPQRRSRLPG